jgi:glycosyltransferase involved in cell wall biosynthesis
LFVSEANLRQIRVLHIVSAGGVASSLQQSLFMPLLTRLPRPRVKSQVACLSPGAVPAAVLRQNGVPVYDLALSRKRFSPRAVTELVEATRQFRPDVIQAWGHTAQIIAAYVRGRCDWKPRLVWAVADTAPLAKNAGLIDRQKLKYAAKFAARADRIVYASEAAASQHRRVGFPDGEHVTITPGVDATRFKPDFEARRKLREQLSLPGEAFVIGMAAPFQPEYDHSTLIKAIGELIKTNPNIAVVLAGHGVQKGNAPLMALVGGGALSTRVHLLGEWSDISALYNACDVVCSSALNDQSRMNLVMAMLCGVPCVATGMGAQGEVIAQHGVAIEPGSPAAFVKGISRVMQLTPEKRTHMAQGARKHALANYVYVRSLQKYLQLYYDLIGRQSLVTQELPTPEIDATLTVPPALPTEAQMSASKRRPTVVDLSDPDSLESKVSERAPDDLPKWRLEQEQERSKREAEVAAKVASTQTNGDVLQVFESEIAKPTTATAMTERARGVADDSEELLSPESLAAEAPPPPRASTGPSGAKKSAAAPAAAAPQADAAKQAALKAARMAALQPIATQANVAATKPAPAITAAKAAPATTPPATPDFLATQPVDMLSAAALMQPAQASTAPTPTPAAPVFAPVVEAKQEQIDLGLTQPLTTMPEAAVMATIAAAVPVQATAPVQPPTIDFSATQSLELPGVFVTPVVAAAAEAAPSSDAEVKAEPNEQLLATPFASFEAPSVTLEPAPAPVSVSAPAPNPAFELSLMATGAWSATPATNATNATVAPSTEAAPAELNGPETLSLITSPSVAPAVETHEPTLKLAVLPDPAAEPKRVANGE